MYTTLKRFGTLMPLLKLHLKWSLDHVKHILLPGLSRAEDCIRALNIIGFLMTVVKAKEFILSAAA